jgi:hypothetical protein
MQGKNMLYKSWLLPVSIVLISASACFFRPCAEPKYKVPPYIKTIGVVLLDFHSYYLTAGGIDEYSGALTARDKSQIVSSLKSELETFGFTVKMVTHDTADTALAAIEALYKTVCSEIEYHVYGPVLFDSIISGFDYTLGPLQGLYDSLGVDAILYVSGFDETKTKLRHDVANEAKVAAVAGAIVGAVIGFGGGGISLREDITEISAGLVTKNGSLCWYKDYCDRDENTISNHDDADMVARHLFESLPVKRGKK